MKPQGEVWVYIQNRENRLYLPPYFRVAEYLKRRGFHDVLQPDYRPDGEVGDFEVFRRIHPEE